MTATYDDETADVRMPPFNELAEQQALGGMLISAEAIRDVTSIVNSVDFHRPAHQLIFDAIVALNERGEPVDAMTVDAELTKRGEAGRYGGPVYLVELTEKIPTAANAGHAAGQVATKAVLRRMTEIGASVAQLGYEGVGELAELVERAHSLVASLEAPSTASGAELMHISEVYRAVVDDQDTTDEDVRVVPPYKDLQEVIPTLKPGQMVIVGARPGVGKSVVAADFARYTALRRKVGTAMFSLEMNHIELGQRVVAAEAGVLFKQLRDKALTDAEWDRVAKVKTTFDESPFWMSDDFNVSLGHIRARMRKLVRKHDIGLVVIDYLQLMETGGMSESRQQEVSKMSRGLKKLAGELGVVVVVLSQLNRGPTQRADKKPQISDLRESGSLEQDADVVLLLHREDTHDKESQRAGEIDVDVAKNRNGPAGREVVCAFQGHFSRIVDMAGTNWS